MELVVGACDAIAARTVEESPAVHGVWLSSFELSSSLGIADDDLLGVDDWLRCIASVRRATAKPLSIDLGNSEGITASGLTDLLTALGPEAMVVVDDSVHPRRNSFSGTAFSTVSAPQFSSRVERIREAADRASLDVGICLRTETYRRHRRLELTLRHIVEVVARSGRASEFLLVHGLDLRTTDADSLRSLAIPHKLITLSTLSAGATVPELDALNIETLIIPNILTIQRCIEGPRLVEDITISGGSVDGDWQPFPSLYERLRFDDWTEGP